MSPQEGSSAPSTPAARFLAHHRIRHFRCGQNKDQAFPNRGRDAAEFAFIQLNPADWLNFLVVDVDREDALMWVMHPAVPEPTWIIENPLTGHAQAGWAIEPVYRGGGARGAPIRYAAAVQRSLDRLVDGDPAFTRYLVRNPAAEHPAGHVWWGRRTTPWSLGDLKAHMAEFVDPFHDEARDGPQPGVWDPGPAAPWAEGIPRPPVADTAAQVGRNNALFRATRRWLWDRWKTHRQAPTDAAAIAHALALNIELPDPLDEAEVQCLARSAVRQVNAGKGRPTRTSGSDAAHEYLAKLGRRGGQARTPAKAQAAQVNAGKARAARTATADRLRAQAWALRAAGATYQAIADAVGRTVRTVTAWLRTSPPPPAESPSSDQAVLQATGICSRAPGPSAPSVSARACSRAFPGEHAPAAPTPHAAPRSPARPRDPAPPPDLPPPSSPTLGFASLLEGL